jgi:hypothetical protein
MKRLMFAALTVGGTMHASTVRVTAKAAPAAKK